jgi:hypothetical protein
VNSIRVLGSSPRSCAAHRSGCGLLQRTWHGGAVNQRGKARNELDAVVVPIDEGQRGAAATPFAGLQSRQFPAHTGATRPGRAVVIDLASGKVVKIGAKVIAHARCTVFQMAEVGVPRELFVRILEMIDDR